jgi:hypothetical protein
MKKIVFLFAAIAALSSCTITKRHYAPGYHVDWKSRNAVKVNHDVVAESAQNEIIEPFVQTPTEQILPEVSASSNARMNFEWMNGDGAEVKGDQLAEVNQLPVPSEQVQEESQTLSLNDEVEETEAQNYSPEPAPEEDINKLALIGFICSVASSFLFFPALPGLILSIIGYKQIMQGNGTGKGLAIAGIVVGALYTLIILIYIAIVAFQVLYYY